MGTGITIQHLSKRSLGRRVGRNFVTTGPIFRRGSLRRIDGKRSINEILSELGMPASKIRKHLEEALDYGIISFY